MSPRIKKPTGLKTSFLEIINKRGILKFLIKVVLTALAVYVVIRKIDLAETKRILLTANLFWLFLALIIFNLSKWISAVRLNLFFRRIGLNLAFKYNLILYYVGMFYNLFLPGGIGGDGYKVYLLNKKFGTPVKSLIGATLLDRINGMVALIFLAILLFLFVDFNYGGISWSYYLLGLMIITYPVFYLFVRLFFRRFSQSFLKPNVASFGVQVSQLICAMLILWSLDIHTLYIEYLVLFLLSSIVAVLPFTIGGIGARELVFIFGANYLLIDKNTAVAFSLLFFILTAISSFSGTFLEYRLNPKKI